MEGMLYQTVLFITLRVSVSCRLWVPLLAKIM